MLGGVEIVPHAGSLSQQLSPLGGPEIVRLSGGAGVPMTHWSRWSISIGASGFMPPGLAGLDYTHQPLELRCTKHLSTSGTSLVYTIDGTPRDDFAPWAEALVGRQWVPTDMSLSGRTATVVPVDGATQYRVCWMPAFIVSGKRPRESLDDGSNSHSWQFDCEEV